MQVGGWAWGEPGVDDRPRAVGDAAAPTCWAFVACRMSGQQRSSQTALVVPSEPSARSRRPRPHQWAFGPSGRPDACWRLRPCSRWGRETCGLTTTSCSWNSSDHDAAPDRIVEPGSTRGSAGRCRPAFFAARLAISTTPCIRRNQKSPWGARGGEATGVSRQTVRRWRQHPGFQEAQRRAGARWWTWWRRDLREQAAQRAAERAGLPLSELPAYL